MEREIICFWNIAELFNKCEETWEYLEDFDIVRKDVEKRLKRDCRRTDSTMYQERSIKRKIITTVSKRVRNIEVMEAAMECKMEYNENKWRIITVKR